MKTSIVQLLIFYQFAWKKTDGVNPGGAFFALPKNNQVHYSGEKSYIYIYYFVTLSSSKNKEVTDRNSSGQLFLIDQNSSGQ